MGDASYVGEFANGLPHGDGTLSFGDGSWYKGQFIAGKQTGVGTYYSSAEDTLTEGEFEDGKAQEHCTVIFKYSDPQNRRVVKGYSKLRLVHVQYTLFQIIPTIIEAL